MAPKITTAAAVVGMGLTGLLWSGIGAHIHMKRKRIDTCSNLVCAKKSFMVQESAVMRIKENESLETWKILYLGAIY